MGEQEIIQDTAEEEMRAFVKALLEDVHALEHMLEAGLIESGIRRIGAEQEIFLVDDAFQPRNSAGAILERLAGGNYTVELGQFNLEANLTPQVLEGGCLAAMELELRELLDRASAAAADERTHLVLCGILPTLTKEHLGLESMTQSSRFLRLNELMLKMRGGEFRTMIKGLDELQTTHDNVMLEACNTSFQVHFQVGDEEFAKLYNLAQAVTAPVLAAAVNSPVLLQHRLWHETRVALFQQSLDVRSEGKINRGGKQRVSFGDKWIKRSVMEIYRDDIARNRTLIAVDPEESPFSMLERGEVPPLKALCLHNGTVYRWNRPCYGVKDGKAHLRIENRVLPAGPTVVDEIANAAFFFGLMCALGEEYGDITEVMAFDDARGNFMAAARYGLDAQFRWLHGKAITAEELILGHLLPLARKGLVDHGLDAGDIARYFGVLEARVRRRRTGAQWALDSLALMDDSASLDERYRSLTRSMSRFQAIGQPVHTWELADLDEETREPASFRRVGQVMTKDLFTVHPGDLIDLAVNLMDWEHIRHVPVEDDDGHLVGLVSLRSLLRRVTRSPAGAGERVAVREIMKTDPVTVEPESSCVDAIELMRRNQVGCLPVVTADKLVGIVTEHDFIGVAAKLLDRWLKDES